MDAGDEVFGGSVRRNLSAQITEELGRRIVRGDYGDEGLLPNEATLGAELSVSRAVVREAAKQIAAKNLVEIRARTGTRVRPREDWTLLDIDVLRWRYATMPGETFLSLMFELRWAIEPAAAELAACRRSDQDAARLLDKAHALEGMVPTSTEAIEADLGYHALLLAATKNELFAHMSKVIGVGLRTAHKLSPHAFPSSVPMHITVATEILDGRPHGARQAMLDLLSISSTANAEAVAANS